MIRVMRMLERTIKNHQRRKPRLANLMNQLVKKKVMTVNQPRRKAMKKRKKKRKMNTNLMKMKIPQRRKEDRQADNLLANLLPRPSPEDAHLVLISRRSLWLKIPTQNQKNPEMIRMPHLLLPPPRSVDRNPVPKLHAR